MLKSFHPLVSRTSVQTAGAVKTMEATSTQPFPSARFADLSADLTDKFQGIWNAEFPSARFADLSADS